ncbi:MAG: serine hydrolase, partial [Pseudomonadales bacterium]|nr:serine hydrolase [Pseudomonadales bacterium]
NRAAGYMKHQGRFLNADYLSMTLPYAAGALASNVDDLFRWNRALSRNEFFTEASTAAMRTPYTLLDGTETNYGFGVRLGSWGDQLLVEHSGGINGFVCHGLRAEPRDLLVVVTNCSTGPSPSNLAFKALCEVMGEPYERPPRDIVANMEDLEGNYQLGLMACRVEAADDELLLHGFGEGPAHYYPIGDDEFAEVNNEFLRIRFDRSGPEVTMTLMLRDAMPVTATREART